MRVILAYISGNTTIEVDGFTLANGMLVAGDRVIAKATLSDAGRLIWKDSRGLELGYVEVKP